MNSQRIGFIGTGIMGLPMAKNLLEAGFRLAVFNRTAQRAEPLVKLGAKRASTAAEAARNADIVISIVTDSPDVEDVYLGELGIASSIQPDTLCIDMSTIAPDTARKVGESVTKAGGRFLDAPVSGGKTGAESGTLSIMAGGSKDDLRIAEPVFNVLGKNTVHGGPVGTGQLMKLCNQIICGLNLLAVAEAIVFARKNNLDVGPMLEAVSGGAAGSWAVSNLGKRMHERDFDPMFMIDLQQKDLRLVLEAAANTATPLAGTALVNQLLGANQAAGEGTQGTQAVVKTIERLAGINS